MSEFRVASRYAKSLLDLSKEKGQVESVKGDMAYFAEVCDKNRDFLLMLKSPIIPSDKKLKIIYQIFADKVNPITLSIFDITV
ncbi:MAG: F0F1 ATP synthase subunit delta, partial [Cytophagales bacterium]